MIYGIDHSMSAACLLTCPRDGSWPAQEATGSKIRSTLINTLVTAVEPFDDQDAFIRTRLADAEKGDLVRAFVRIHPAAVQ